MIRRIQYWETTKNRRIQAKQKQDSIAVTVPAFQSIPPEMPAQSQTISNNHLINEHIGTEENKNSFPVQAGKENVMPIKDYVLDPMKPQLDPLNITLFRFPIIDWDYRWQRPQQICQQFARHGYKVFYFSIETVQLNRPDATFDEIQATVQIKEAEENVWLIKLCSYNSLNAYRDAIKHPLDKLYMKWSIEVLKQKFNIHQTVSIVDLPFWSSIVFDLEDNKVIYDCMDEHAGFSNASAELLALEPELIKKADAVVTSSDILYQKAQNFNSSVHLIRNAGEFDHFAVKPQQLPLDISMVGKPIIGYIGAIAEWFDMNLVFEIAERNPDWNFVLIGNTYYSDTSNIEKLNNVFILGEKPYKELPAYLHAFDVSIIPFQINALTLATNPVKVYEYMAAGKPIVSTALPELAPMKDYVSIATGTMEFETAIWRAFHEKEAEQSTNAKKRRQYAADNTWKDRYHEFQSIILNQLYPKISIIIVTHNNWELTDRCLGSLLQYTTVPRFEIIIVDNASTDQTPANLLKLTHPNIKTILLSENDGFAGGNNIGIINATGDYVVLLNNDTMVSKDWLPRLMQPFKTDHQIAAVGPMSNFVGNDQKLDFFVGDEVYGANAAWLDEFHALFDKRFRYTDMLGFFCVMIKKEIFEKLGHLDKSFGCGMFEDDDYCLRMLQAGYRLAIAEDAFVYHHGSATFNQWDEEQKRSLFLTNKAYYETKWSRTWTEPKMPHSLFTNLVDPDKIAEIVAASNKSSVFVKCPDNWNSPREEWQERLLQICNDQTIVIACVQTYLGKPIHGIRKIGPSLYFTNNELLVEKINFNFNYVLTDLEHRGELHGDEKRLLTSV
ncbi:glycosyltransferase [Paenibacillus lentus]|uniref:glycosyltransferase n=1 Tax=Paenibacillus lentus TaxID=1338368 RepID=UPI003661AC13